MNSAVLTVVLMMVATACLELPQAPPAPAPERTTPLAVGQSVNVQLYSMRLDVTGYEQVITLADLQALPRATREKMWLYNLDLNGHDGSPRLLDNALAQIRDRDPFAKGVSTAERNMIRLLNMTPGNADLTGTTTEELLSIGPKIGIPSAQVLADALGIAVDAPFLSQKAISQAVIEGLIGTHPNARFRNGAKSAAHPDGKIPVPPGHLPVTLDDVVSKLANMPTRFGAWKKDGVYHPGFIVGVTEADILEDGFRMILKANTNALPFKGLDLSHGAIGSVASIGKDGGAMFDFNDPNWLRIEGLTDKPVLTRMAFQMVEHPTWLKPGNSPLPKPWGNSEAWTAPTWTIERILAHGGLLDFKTRSYTKGYVLGTDPSPQFTVSIDDGWMVMKSKGDVGKPPAPKYIWDMMLEVAQLRLHDGPDPFAPTKDRIPEGQANVRFELQDIAVGITSAQITETVRRNLERDASQLIGAASHIIEQHHGKPDIYYYRPRATSGDAGTDWLYFIIADDLPDGDKRSYAKAGFFADASLTQQLSTNAWVDGDDTHQKVKVNAGDVLFCADDSGRVFRIEVTTKPSRARIGLKLTRVQ